MGLCLGLDALRKWEYSMLGYLNKVCWKEARINEYKVLIGKEARAAYFS